MISFNSPHSQHGANSIWHLFFKYFFSEKLSSHLFELAYLFYKLKNTYQHDYSRQHLYLVQNIWYVHNFWNFFRCKFWSNLTSTIQFIWNNNKKKKKSLKIQKYIWRGECNRCIFRLKPYLYIQSSEKAQQ